MNSTININMNINKENKSLVKTLSSSNPSKQTNSVNPLKQTKSSASSEKKVETVKTVKTIEPVKISNEDQSEIANYINSLSKHETQTLEIAKSHLGSSFTIRKSIGFLEWNSKQKQKQE
jgi:hypothetical protein